MNTATWLTDVQADKPCGDDLEYDNDFIALLQSAQGKEEQQYGDTVIPAVEPDWRDVAKRGESLLSRTRDIRVFVLLLRAAIRLNGLEAIGPGLSALVHTLDTRWETLHPQLVVDGDADPVFRANALAALVDSAGLLRDIRQASFLKTGLGVLAIKDVEAALEAGGQGGAYSRDQLSAIFADHADHPAVHALLAAELSLRTLMDLCNERFGAEIAPDFSPLLGILKPVAALIRSCQSQASEPELDAIPASEEAVGSSHPSVVVPRSNALTEIRSREDVTKLLELVCNYLERHEPTNPAPLLIRRAQAVMSMGFLDLVKELASEGTRQIEVIAGTRSGG